MSASVQQDNSDISIPWFGARRAARRLASEVQDLRSKLDRITQLGHQLVAETKSARADRDIALRQLERIGGLSHFDIERQGSLLKSEISHRIALLERERATVDADLEEARNKLREVRRDIVETDEIALLQEAGIYRYRHPLTDVVAYEKELAKIDDRIKSMAAKDGGAILSATDWTVNGSAKEGRAMVRDFSKLMLRAFNAEADNLVRGLKPHKIDGAIDRLRKVADTIQRLGKTMSISISGPYLQLRVWELELTADYLQKEAEAKEAERDGRERMREERKAQQEIEWERSRLERERQHHFNALNALIEKGDEAGAARMRLQLDEVELAVQQMDYRVANERAGYVYVISNIGSFGERIVKVGMTRRLDPMDRIRELSDASVPFNFDVHALFFSKDAVGIETEMHQRLANARVNTVNLRREFFRASPLEVKELLSKLTGELLQFQEVPEAIEYRQCMGSAARQL